MKKILYMGVFLGVLVSLWIFLSMNANIIERRTETLANMCDERARMLQDQFNVSMNHVRAMAILVATFHHGKNPSAIDQVKYFIYAFFVLLIYQYSLSIEDSPHMPWFLKFGYVFGALSLS